MIQKNRSWWASKGRRPAWCSQLDRLTVWCVAIGVCPRLLALPEGDAIEELLLGNQLFERRQPVLEIARALLRFAAPHHRLELCAQGGRPLRPREVPRRGQLHRQRKRLGLPGLRKHGAACVAGQQRRRREALCSVVDVRPSQGSPPTYQCTGRRAPTLLRPTTRAP